MRHPGEVAAPVVEDIGAVGQQDGRLRLRAGAQRHRKRRVGDLRRDPAAVTFGADAGEAAAEEGDAQVGQMAAVIRSQRPPEPYLGKGVKYSYERIRRKAGKAGK